MTLSISCASCGRKYSLADQWLGKKVKCKECGAVILVQAASPAPAAKSPPKSVAIQRAVRRVPPKKTREAVKEEERPRRRRAEDDDDDVRPKSRRRKTVAKEKSNVLLWVGGIGGVLLLLGIVGSAVFWMTRRPAAKQPPLAAIAFNELKRDEPAAIRKADRQLDEDAPNGAAAIAGFKTMTGKDGSYQFLFPSDAKNIRTQEQPVTLAELDGTEEVHQCEMADGTSFAVAARKLSGPKLKQLNISESYDLTVDLLKQKCFEVSDPKEFAFGAEKGREFRLYGNQAYFRKAILIRPDGRVFEVVVASKSREELTSPRSETVFNSLKILVNDLPAAPDRAVAAPVAAVPDDFGPSRVLEPGVTFQQATLKPQRVPMMVWLYLPKNAEAKKLPLVLVPPAGSTLVTGMNLGEDDRKEHLPYVKAGFAVASFEIDGFVANLQDNEAITKGSQLFKDSQAGIKNAKAALDFVLAKSAKIDPDRIFIAGHSSAGTLALVAAAEDTRIKGCIAYAPAIDVVGRLGPLLPDLERAVPGITDLVHYSSPKTHIDKLKVPILLFHAKDDNNTPIQQTTAFADALKKTNSQVTMISVAMGGHYDSMINEGLPKGIHWLKKLTK